MSANFSDRLYVTAFIIGVTDVEPAAVMALQRKVLSELDGGFVCQKLSPLHLTRPPSVLWANFFRRRGTRGMSLLTARCGAEGGEDDEGWREKRDNTSLFGKLSAEKLQKPFACLCQTGEHRLHFNSHTYLLWTVLEGLLCLFGQRAF